MTIQTPYSTKFNDHGVSYNEENEFSIQQGKITNNSVSSDAMFLKFRLNQSCCILSGATLYNACSITHHTLTFITLQPISLRLVLFYVVPFKSKT